MESEINQTFESRYSLFSNQTSGHSCMIKVTNGSDHILKPLGASEQDFYEDAKSRNPPNFLNFIPKYYGVYYPAPAEISFFSELAKKLIGGEENPNSETLRKKNKQHNTFLQKLYSERFAPKAYIKMEDLTRGMRTPRILDLKMGFTAYNIKKFETQAKKYKESTCSTEGFRFAGFKTYLRTKDEILFRDKYWGFKLQQKDLLQAFALFFYDGEKILKDFVLKFIAKIDIMIESLDEMRGYSFYSCSLLLIYDEKNAENGEFEEVQLKLIDFANVVYSEENKNEADQSILKALKNIKFYLETLSERENMPVDTCI